MSPKKPAGSNQSAVNAVALQNLRIIRRRINDKAWVNAAEKKLAKTNPSLKKPDLTVIGDKDKSGYEEVLRFTILKLVDEYAEKGKIDEGWRAENGMPLPEFPNTRKKFAAATGIDEGHLRSLEDGIVDFTLEDAIRIARVGNMDLATFLTPSLDDLEKEIYFPLTPSSPRYGFPLMSEWLMWIHGYRPLPGQDRDEFIKQTGSPAPSMQSLDDTRTYRGHDMVAKDEKLMHGSKVYVMGIADNLDNPNPFKAPLTPYDKSSTTTQSLPHANLVLIQNVLLLATQMKKIMSTKEKGALKMKRARFVALVDFLRYSISAIVRLLLKLSK